MHKSGCSYFVNRCLIRHYLTLTKGACLFVLPNSVQLEEHIIRGWWFKSRFCVWKLLSISDMSADLWQKKIWHVCAVWAEIQTCLNVDHVLSISEHREMHQNQSRGLHLQKNIQHKDFCSILKMWDLQDKKEDLLWISYIFHVLLYTEKKKICSHFPLRIRFLSLVDFLPRQSKTETSCLLTGVKMTWRRF